MPNRLRSWWGTTIGSGPITREHPPLALLWLGLIALGPLLWNLSVTGPTTLGPGLDGELYYVTSPTAGWWAFPWWLARLHLAHEPTGRAPRRPPVRPSTRRR